MQNKLKIAIQKSGRLYEESVKLLKECGIGLGNGLNTLKAEAQNFPIEVYFLRDDDIPQYVQDGVADIGIAGENIVRESNKKLEVLERLGFGKCRLSIAVPKAMDYKKILDLNGKKIATTYPFLLTEFLQKENIQAEIHEISGSVEIAPSIGLAHAICDIVSSGSTLFMNGLKEVEVVMQTEAVLVSNTSVDTDKSKILDELLFRIRAVKKSKNNKYILLNAPNDKLDVICKILPGMKSPTILPLTEAGWSSVHSVVNEDEFWDIIGKLKENGAQGILIIPIEKMIL